MEICKMILLNQIVAYVALLYYEHIYKTMLVTRLKGINNSMIFNQTKIKLKLSTYLIFRGATKHSLSN